MLRKSCAQGGAMQMRIGLPLVLTVALAVPAVAQDFRGSIAGRVVDESGAALPGAAVSITETATGSAATTITNTEGRYQVPLLQPGVYRITVELEGFRRVERNNVEVRVDDHVVVDVTLKVGQLTETVTVTAETPLLEEANGSAGQVIDQKRLELMPLSDGNPFTLTRLASGVVPFGNLLYFRPFDNNATAEFSASGAPTSNAYTLDGAPNQAHRQGDADSRMAFTPPAGAVQEYKIQTSTFDAQQGRAAGATINVAMRSGSNTIRGDGYYYYRDERMADTEYFLKRRNQPEPALDYNRRGLNIGGPIRLGRLYEGRNRTFFFTALEWLDDRFPDASQRTVPTVKQRSGDFSELLSQGIIIYDPATAFTNAAGRVERLSFPGNIIPADRISPIAREYLKYYPLPNQPGDAQGRNNYLSGVTRDDDFYSFNVRIDHQLSSTHKMFGRYSRNDRMETRGHWAGELNGVRPVGFYLFRINDAVALDYVWTTSSSSVLNVRGSWNRFDERDPRQSQDTFDPATLGFSPQTVALFRGYRYLPQLDLDTGFSEIGSNWAGGITFSGWAFQPTWTKLAGKHSIRTGYDLRVTREDESFDGHPAGLYTFRGNFTRQSETSSNQFGQDLASLMLGIPTGGRIEQFGDRFNQVFYHGVFVQDDWKVTRRLTLNLGVRYEYEGAPTERFNRNVRGFDPNAALEIATAAEAAYGASPIPEIPSSQFRVRGGVRFVDDDHRGFWNADLNNIQPRVGFAFRGNSKTVFRGGWAIYTQPAYVHGARQLGFSSSTPITPTLDAGRTFRATWFNPVPDGALLDPLGQSRGPNTGLGQTLARFYDDIGFRNGQAMRFIVGIQRELPGRFIAEASYVGTRAYDLRTDVQVNALPNEYLSRSPIRDDATIGYLNNTAVPNPLRGLVPGTNLNGTNTQRQRLLRPFPQFESIEGRRYDGSSRYDSLQLRLDRRFYKGFSFLTTYTHARALERLTRLNEADTEYEERLARTDVPHRIVVNPIWELPFGKGRAIGRQATRLVDGLVGGWSVSAIWQYQSGEPLTLGNRYYAGDISSLTATISEAGVDDPVFDTTRFYFRDEPVQTNGVVNPALQRSDSRKNLDRNFRTLPSRVSGLRGSPLNYWDMSIVKRLNLIGRVRAQLHFELYNASNFVWFQAPNLDPSNADFAKLTGTRNLPREVQLGARVTF